MDRITVALLRARRQGGAVDGESLRPRLDDAARKVLEMPGRIRGSSSKVDVYERQASEPRMADAETLGLDLNTDTIERPTPAIPSLPVPSDRARTNGPTRFRYSRSRVVKVSHQHFADRRVAIDHAHPELLDAVRVLRTQVLQRMRENGWQTLAIVSPGDDDGKSLVAVNLAVSIAMDMNHTALLVDANLRRPAVHSYFGISHKPGLAHHLVRNAPIESLLVNPGLNRLLVMPAGASQPNSAELLGSERMRELVDDLRNRYPERITIFDLPPLLSSADALTFLPCVDATLLVVGDGVTSREEVQRAEALLGSTNVVGVTLNFARERGARDGRRTGFFRRLLNLS